MMFGRPKQPDRAGTVKREAWFDLHSHFLPGIDDGCQTAEESIKLLRYARSRGVLGMVATPHYYPEQPIEKFLVKRNDASKKLREMLEGQDVKVPAWCLGAEVAYYEGISGADGIERLRMGQSDYLLLELPFQNWSNTIFRDINTLINQYNITPILAHLERYLGIAEKGMIEQLYEMDVLIQMNGGYIVRHSREAKKRIKNGLVGVLGSDSHNMTTRMPNLDEAFAILESAGLKEEKDILRRNNKAVFMAAMGRNE